MFDTEIFLNLKTKEDKILYLDNCDYTISITNVLYNHYNSIFNQCEDVLYSLAKKRFCCNDTSILSMICIRSHSSDFVIKVLSLYEKNGWFTTISELTIIHDIVVDTGCFYSRDNNLIEFTIQLYDRLNIPINIKNGWRTKDMDSLEAVCEYGTITNFIKIIKLYNERKLYICKNIFLKYISHLYYKIKKEDIVLLDELVDICIKFDILLYNKDQITDKWNKIIDPLYYMSKCMDNWICLKKIIDVHLVNNYEINTNNNLLIYVGRHYNIDAVKFILDYCKKNNMDINSTTINKTFTDNIIQHNSLEVLQYILSQGVIPKNNIIKKYIPCPDCYNGEGHCCNFRNITTEYISLKRYNVKLDELHKVTIPCDPVDFSYYEFNEIADDTY